MRVTQRVKVKRTTDESYFAVVVEESVAIQAAQVGHEWGLAWVEEVTRPARKQIALRYFRPGSANAHLREEAEQEAWRGVLRALSAYRLDKGRRFIDYATHQIRNVVGKYRQRVTHPVRLPSHQWEARQKAGRDGGDVHQSVQRLMARGKSRHEATLICTISSVPIHLEDEDTPSYTPVACGQAPDTELIAEENKRVVAKLLGSLPPHLARALALSNDLDFGGRESLQHMSSTERRQIQALAREAMTILRDKVNGQSLDRFVEASLAATPDKAPPAPKAPVTPPLDAPALAARASAGDAACAARLRKMLASAYRRDAKAVAAGRDRREQNIVLRAGVARAMDLLARFNPSLDVGLADQLRRAAVAAMRAAATSMPQPSPTGPTCRTPCPSCEPPSCPDVLGEMPLIEAARAGADWVKPWIASVQRYVVRRAVAAGRARAQVVAAVARITQTVIDGYQTVGTLATQLLEAVLQLVAPHAPAARRSPKDSRQRQTCGDTLLANNRLVPP